MEISLAAETLFKLGPIQVTNSLLSAFIIFFVLSFTALIIGRGIKVENPSKLQLAMESIINGFKSIATDILGEMRTRQLFSFLFTFFVFIVVSNWFGLLPFVGPIVLEHHTEEATTETHDETGADTKAEEGEEKGEKEEEPSIINCIVDRDCILTSSHIKKTEAFPVFRAPTSDVSATLAMALIAVATIHTLGFKAMKSAYLKKYFNFSNPIDGFVGILELISEIGKIISFTFRLFGNIFAGEVLLLVITSISFGVATLPFMALEVFVGFIQAFVFFMLTAVFISVAVTPHEHE